MQLSIQQTAELLGKTRRQVIYMIKQKQLPAQKVGGRWCVERADLGVDEAKQQRTKVRAGQFREAMEEALASASKKQQYTMGDLYAVKIAIPIYRELLARGPEWESASTRLRECLDHLAVGCHRFNSREKSASYRSARDAASLAAMELLLRSEDGNDALLQRIEGELMHAFAGILKRSESESSKLSRL